MIDSDEIIRTFEENFKKMSYEEREKYLKEMGFSFGTDVNPQTKGVLHYAGRIKMRRRSAASTNVRKKKKEADNVYIGARIAKNKA